MNRFRWRNGLAWALVLGLAVWALPIRFGMTITKNNDPMPDFYFDLKSKKPLKGVVRVDTISFIVSPEELRESVGIKGLATNQMKEYPVVTTDDELRPTFSKGLFNCEWGMSSGSSSPNNPLRNSDGSISIKYYFNNHFDEWDPSSHAFIYPNVTIPAAIPPVQLDEDQPVIINGSIIMFETHIAPKIINPNAPLSNIGMAECYPPQERICFEGQATTKKDVYYIWLKEMKTTRGETWTFMVRVYFE